MATATMATAAGAAALLYYTLNRKLRLDTEHEDEENVGYSSTMVPVGIDRVSNRLIQAPATWIETISTLSETLRFTYSETLGKWPIGDLAFGISFLLKRQVRNHTSRFYQLKGMRNVLFSCFHLLIREEFSSSFWPLKNFLLGLENTKEWVGAYIFCILTS